MQVCDEVRFCRLDKTHKADIKRITLNIVSPEKWLFVLKALSQKEAERNHGRAPPTAMERELQTFLEDSQWRSAYKRGSTSFRSRSASLRDYAITRGNASSPISWKTLQRPRLSYGCGPAVKSHG